MDVRGEAEGVRVRGRGWGLKVGGSELVGVFILVVLLGLDFDDVSPRFEDVGGSGVRLEEFRRKKLNRDNRLLEEELPTGDEGVVSGDTGVSEISIIGCR